METRKPLVKTVVHGIERVDKTVVYVVQSIAACSVRGLDVRCWVRALDLHLLSRWYLTRRWSELRKGVSYVD